MANPPPVVIKFEIPGRVFTGLSKLSKQYGQLPNATACDLFMAAYSTKFQETGDEAMNEAVAKVGGTPASLASDDKLRASILEMSDKIVAAAAERDVMAKEVRSEKEVSALLRKQVADQAKIIAGNPEIIKALRAEIDDKNKTIGELEIETKADKKAIASRDRIIKERDKTVAECQKYIEDKYGAAQPSAGGTANLDAKPDAGPQEAKEDIDAGEAERDALAARVAELEKMLLESTTLLAEMNDIAGDLKKSNDGLDSQLQARDKQLAAIANAPPVVVQLAAQPVESALRIAELEALADAAAAEVASLALNSDKVVARLEEALEYNAKLDALLAESNARKAVTSNDLIAAIVMADGANLLDRGQIAVATGLSRQSVDRVINSWKTVRETNGRALA